MAVVKGNDDELRLRYMEHFTAVDDESSSDSRHTNNGHPRFTTHLYGIAIESAAAAGLSLTFATSCLQHHFNDDILAIIQRSVNKSKISFIQFLIAFAYNAVSVERILDGIITSTSTIVDYSADNNYERLLRSPVFQRVMSVQHMLGNVDKWPNLSSKMAWCILNLRISALTWHLSLSGIADNSSGGK